MDHRITYNGSCTFSFVDMRLLSLAFAGGCLLAATPTSAAASSKALLQSDASLDPQLETEMSKLNDYLQANKDNEVHVVAFHTLPRLGRAPRRMRDSIGTNRSHLAGVTVRRSPATLLGP